MLTLQSQYLKKNLTYFTFFKTGIDSYSVDNFSFYVSGTFSTKILTYCPF